MNDNGGYRNMKKTIKPLKSFGLKFGYKEANILAKKLKKANQETAAAVAANKKKTGDTADKAKKNRNLSLATKQKISEFCELLGAVEYEKDRLTEYVIALNLRGVGIALNAWSVSQLAPTNLIRNFSAAATTTAAVSKTAVTAKTTGRRNSKRKTTAATAMAVSENFWIMTIRVETAGSGFSKRQPDTITMLIPLINDSDSENHSLKSLLVEYMVYRLWMIVRYAFNTVALAVNQNGCTSVPLFMVVVDAKSPCGRFIKNLLLTSHLREVVELKTVYRCSFVFK